MFSIIFTACKPERSAVSATCGTTFTRNRFADCKRNGIVVQSASASPSIGASSYRARSLRGLASDSGNGIEGTPRSACPIGDSEGSDAENPRNLAAQRIRIAATATIKVCPADHVRRLERDTSGRRSRQAGDLARASQHPLDRLARPEQPSFRPRLRDSRDRSSVQKAAPQHRQCAGDSSCDVRGTPRARMPAPSRSRVRIGTQPLRTWRSRRSPGLRRALARSPPGSSPPGQ